MVREIEKADNAMAEVEKTTLEIEDALCKFVENAPLSQPHVGVVPNLDNSHVSVTSAARSVRAKLPKLELSKFSGKICNWQEFWDGFSSSVDMNDQLSDVDKFAYLRGYLEESAK